MSNEASLSREGSTLSDSVEDTVNKQNDSTPAAPSDETNGTVSTTGHQQQQARHRKQQGGPTEGTKKQGGKTAASSAAVAATKTKSNKHKPKKQAASVPSTTEGDADSQRAASPESSDSVETQGTRGRRGSAGSAAGSEHGRPSAKAAQLTRQRSKVRFQEGNDDGGGGGRNKPTLRPPSATSKPSISGIVGARKLGMKWRLMINNETGSGGGMPAPSISDQDRMEAALLAADSETMAPAPPRRAKGSDVINPTVNGMRQFGISKGVISRAIVKFSSPPTPHPLTVCFHFPGTFLTHRYVLDMVRTKMQLLDGSDGVGKVTMVQFIDRNTIHGTQGMDNRWLVTLTTSECVDILLRQGLHLFNRKIMLRRYDDILSEEYAEYIEYRNLHNKLYAKEDENAADGEEQTTSASAAEKDDENEDDASDDELGGRTSRSDKETAPLSASRSSNNGNDVIDAGRGGAASQLSLQDVD